MPLHVVKRGPGRPRKVLPEEPTPDGQQDAAAAAAAFTAPQPEAAPPAPPTYKKPSGAEYRRRAKVSAAVPPPLTTPEEREFWAAQLKNLADSLREARPWHPELTAEMARPAGEPLALVVKKYTPSAQERPEVVLLVVLAPWLITVARAEWTHAQEVTRARRAATGDERRDLRSQGIREDDLSAAATIGTSALPDY